MPAIKLSFQSKSICCSFNSENSPQKSLSRNRDPADSIVDRVSKALRKCSLLDIKPKSKKILSIYINYYSRLRNIIEGEDRCVPKRAMENVVDNFGSTNFKKAYQMFSKKNQIFRHNQKYFRRNCLSELFNLKSFAPISIENTLVRILLQKTNTGEIKIETQKPVNPSKAGKITKILSSKKRLGFHLSQQVAQIDTQKTFAEIEGLRKLLSSSSDAELINRVCTGLRRQMEGVLSFIRLQPITLLEQREEFLYGKMKARYNSSLPDLSYLLS